MKRLVFALAFLLAACTTAANDNDIDVRATVIAEFNVISGPAGRRDWNRFKELFAPGAKIVTAGESLTPDEYVTKNKPWFDANGLFQHPTTMRVERHGDSAHVIASDESRHASNDEKPYEQGATTFDLVRVGEAWKIVTITRQ